MITCECNCDLKKKANCDPVTRKGCINPAMEIKQTTAHAPVRVFDSPDPDTFLFDVMEKVTSR